MVGTDEFVRRNYPTMVFFRRNSAFRNVQGEVNVLIELVLMNITPFDAVFGIKVHE